MSAKAAATRLTILNQAFILIYRQGYRTTSIDEIIATTQVTKGAFFYHFKNKDEMGIALIEEVLYPRMKQAIIDSLENTDDSKQAIYIMMKAILLQDSFFDVKYGCPAINLIEELSSYNELFKMALYKLSEQWKEAIIICLEKDKAAGKLNKVINSEEVAIFVLSGYSGIRNLGKLFGSQCYTSYLRALKKYLKHL